MTESSPAQADPVKSDSVKPDAVKKEPVRIEVITQAMLRAGPHAWSDPAGISTLTPEKRQTLLDNPMVTDDQSPVQLLGVRGGEVIGRLDLLHGRIRVDGEEVPIAWGSEWYVPAEHRSSLVGVSLILKQSQIAPNIGANGISQVAVEVYKKLKWIDLPMPRWILLRRSRSVVERYAGKGPHSTIAAVLIDIGLWFHKGLLKLLWGGLARRWKQERVDRFPADLEPLLAKAQDPAPVSCHRSASWLNWLMSHSFKTDSRNANLMHLVRASDGRCVGYTVSKVRFFNVATHRGFKDVLLGAVQEFAAFDPAITEAELVKLAVLALDRHGVDAIEVCLDDAQIGQSLKKIGFMRVGSMHMMFKGSNKSPLSRPELCQPSSWRTRPIDGDNFFV